MPQAQQPLLYAHPRSVHKVLVAYPFFRRSLVEQTLKSVQNNLIRKLTAWRSTAALQVMLLEASPGGDLPDGFSYQLWDLEYFCNFSQKTTMFQWFAG